MKNVLTLSTVLAITGSTFAGSPGTLLFEGFETDGQGTRYTASQPFFDGVNDYWKRTDASDINLGLQFNYSNYGGDWFWAAEDVDDDGGNGNDEQQMLFNTISTAGYTNLELSGLFGAGNGGSYDPDDHIQLWVSYDAQPFELVMAFESDSTDTNSRPLLHDTDLDGLGDGVQVTPLDLQLFSVTLQEASTIQLEIRVEMDGSGEQIAFDNITITGFEAIPTPGALVLLGLAGVAARRRRRGSM